MPVTVDMVRTHLGLDPASTIDQAAMQAACDATNSLAVSIPVPGTTEDGLSLPTWPVHVDQGAVLHASRLYGRRGSVQGFAAFADLGFSMLGRIDPDVRFLWGLGEYQKSVVA